MERTIHQLTGDMKATDEPDGFGVWDSVVL